jgi:hypothetical protein
MPPARPAPRAPIGWSGPCWRVSATHYLGALARGQDDNGGKCDALAADARTLIRRFRRFEDMILRFATDLFGPVYQHRGLNKPNALRELFTTGAWLPPALTPAE